MKKNTIITTVLIVLSIGIISISLFNKNSSKTNHQSNSSNNHNLNSTNTQSTEIINPKQTVLNLVSSDIHTVISSSFNKSIDTTGIFKPIKHIQIKAKNTGEISRLIVKVGDKVKQGQVLANIDNSDINARLNQSQAQIKIAEEQLELAKIQYNKNLELSKENFISKSGLDTYKTNLEVAQQNLQTALASHTINKKSSFDRDVVAPFSGIVSSKMLENGTSVTFDTPIMEIVDNSIVELEAGINASQISQIKLGQKVSVNIEGIAQPIEANITRISPSSINNSRLVNVYIQIKNSSDVIKSGIFAKASILLEEKELSAIPESSIVRKSGQKPFVYAINDNKIHKLEIEELGIVQNGLAGVNNLAVGSKIIAIPLPSDTDIEKTIIKM
ncbi:MAG: hypothetical protein RLZZ210_276 [Pseudomonadota bacterium]|jgi:RND family efflux transporter MFP subunit